MTRRRPPDPFAALGLDAAADLTDDDVRAAWRRLATATHPDRADGGDPERFAIAAAAYTDLRTGYGRGEARASLAGIVTEDVPDKPVTTGFSPRALRAGLSPRALRASFPPRALRAVAAVPALVRHGRPVRLALRVAAAGAAATLGVLAAGPGAAGPALVTGAATWLLVTARHDLGAPAAGAAGQPGSGPVATGLAGSADHADHEPT